MYTKVDKVFIGDYIERTATLVDNATVTTAQGDIAEKEIIILDSDYKVMVGASATFANSKVIYIAEGSSEEFTTANPDGSTLTGRRLLISGPIDGTKIVNYNGGAYTAKAEAYQSFTAITDSIVAGTSYKLRVVYKGDIADMHRGQCAETYTYIAKSGDASADIYNGLAAKINKSNRFAIRGTGANLVTAVVSTGTLTITAKPIVSCTTSVNDIDEFVQNGIVAFLNYVDNDYNWAEVGITSASTPVAAVRGFGTWELVRDAEKFSQSYEGLMNRTYFPVIKPEMRVVKGKTYDLIVIENDRKFRTPDNQYNKETSLTQLIALEKGTGATAPQNAEVLATLNTWMASIPTPFANVSF